MSLILVRHGQSEWNKLNIFTGFKDVGLTELGVEQAKQAGLNINQKIDIAFTSDLLRAKRTCNIIHDTLPFNFPVISNKALNERDYGDLTGQNKKEVAEKYGAEQVQLWRRSVDVRPPNGENLLDVIERVGEYFDSHIKSYLLAKQNVLIVAHGNSIRALLCILKIFDTSNINKFELPTGKPMFINYETLQYYFKNDYQIKPRMILDSRGTSC
jgi:2,3-bisphosphoglycerate-dependent phosphoglycerate mutase